MLVLVFQTVVYLSFILGVKLATCEGQSGMAAKDFFAELLGNNLSNRMVHRKGKKCVKNGNEKTSSI